MNRLLLTFLATLALPVAAQSAPSRTEAPETSTVYAEAHGAIGPAFEGIGATPEVGVEVGYQFASGDVLGFAAARRGRPFRLAGPEPGTGGGGPDVDLVVSVVIVYGLGLRRLLPDNYAARHAEIVVGVGAAWFEEGDVGTMVELHPRLVVPLAAWASVPVGLRVAVPLGGPADTGAFFGASLGLRLGASRPDLVRPEDGQASPR